MTVHLLSPSPVFLYKVRWPTPSARLCPVPRIPSWSVRLCGEEGTLGNALYDNILHEMFEKS